MSESILSHDAAVMRRTGAAAARRARATSSTTGPGLWTVLSQLLWHGRPCEAFSDHLLSDIGVTRFELESPQP